MPRRVVQRFRNLLSKVFNRGRLKKEERQSPNQDEGAPEGDNILQFHKKPKDIRTAARIPKDKAE